jgi:hypothetical protein
MLKIREQVAAVYAEDPAANTHLVQTKEVVGGVAASTPSRIPTCRVVACLRGVVVLLRRERETEPLAMGATAKVKAG